MTLFTTCPAARPITWYAVEYLPLPDHLCIVKQRNIPVVPSGWTWKKRVHSATLPLNRKPAHNRYFSSSELDGKSTASASEAKMGIVKKYQYTLPQLKQLLKNGTTRPWKYRYGLLVSCGNHEFASPNFMIFGHNSRELALSRNTMSQKRLFRWLRSLLHGIKGAPRHQGKK